MFRKYKAIPRKLRTIQAPGKKIELWVNDKQVSRLRDVTTDERPFVRDFVETLQELGWEVLVQA